MEGLVGRELANKGGLELTFILRWYYGGEPKEPAELAALVQGNTHRWPALAALLGERNWNPKCLSAVAL